MAASTMAPSTTSTEAGGIWRAKTRRLTGIASNSTRPATMAAISASFQAFSGCAISTSTQMPRANSASMVAVRCSVTLTPDTPRAIQ